MNKIFFKELPNPYRWLFLQRMDDKTMIIAEYKDQIIAQSENSIEIENSIYFPRSDVFMSFLTPTTTVTRCPWKGMATYFDVTVMKNVCKDSAWSYQNPKSKGRLIRCYVAFWKDIVVLKKSDD